jgi:diaminohydroxyphosphoribosylaminopyrimidine deaminase/5-amino-6-(5-phosphoribosylamino)uracil reductase
MRRAIELAWLGRYTTHPNPRVGCVIANGERVVGEGWHRKAGAAHAEPIALEQAGEAARGACAYVTLEPHSFHGKTPPCTEALIRAGIARVVCGMLDPNPKVHGEGIRQLQAAGIATEVGVLAEESRALNLGFQKRMETGLPRVIVKMGASLDGRIALANGESRWITSDAARQDVQRLRASVSAVMTGIGTVITDDPQLTVRDASIDMAGRSLLCASRQRPRFFIRQAPCWSQPASMRVRTPSDSETRRSISSHCRSMPREASICRRSFGNWVGGNATTCSSKPAPDSRGASWRWVCATN